MPNYQAPQRDIQFVMHEVLAMADHYRSVPGGEDIDTPMIDAILEEASKFSENVLAPINASGDAQGCQWNDSVVTTPAGFKEAYAQFVEGGLAITLAQSRSWWARLTRVTGHHG